MAACYPDDTIWPDPSILPVPPEVVDPDNPTEDEQEALDQYEVAATLVEVALELAWSMLQALTAYQVAICPIVIRPCKESCARGSYFAAPAVGPFGTPFYPSVTNGVWTNVWCGHGGWCGCTTIHQVTLPGPVGQIVSVEIDGIPLDPSDYRIDNGNKLVRQDGQGWPVCQDMNAPAGEVGTFTVTYFWGAVAESAVRFAAGVLADEFLKDLTGQECRLPSGTTNIVRQGLTVEVARDLFGDGVTGFPAVDAVILKYNPFKQKMPSSVFSLDRPQGRFTTIGG